MSPQLTRATRERRASVFIGQIAISTMIKSQGESEELFFVVVVTRVLSMDLSFGTSSNATSTASPSSDGTPPLWAGYVAVLISVIFFGSNFVPAARYPIGDGVAFQFFLCCGIWITGLVINLIVGNPQFYPLVLIGGVLWTTGNILSMFVIPITGLGLSMLLWCTSNLFFGNQSCRTDEKTGLV